MRYGPPVNMMGPLDSVNVPPAGVVVCGIAAARLICVSAIFLFARLRPLATASEKKKQLVIRRIAAVTVRHIDVDLRICISIPSLLKTLQRRFPVVVVGGED